MNNQFNEQENVTLNQLTYSIGEKSLKAFSISIDDWKIRNKVHRLWKNDATLWTNSGEHNWLGWLTITLGESSDTQSLLKISQEIKHEGFSQILLIGMGGASLFAEVLKKTFGKLGGFPELYVLDSINPNQIKAVESKLDLTRTLFIVSSKSGSTLETDLLRQYFFEKLRGLFGEMQAGHHFLAITDPKSKLKKIAETHHFRSILLGDPSIGGRFSALSIFGKVPGVLMGMDIAKFINRANYMVKACNASAEEINNPGLILGTILAILGYQQKNKVTFIVSPEISGISSWLEQLLAESTGKKGKGFIPIEGEEMGPPEVYSSDRIFIYLRLIQTKQLKLDKAVEKIQKAGHPVIRIVVDDLYNLSQEFFRWEIAIAVAGSILQINPFNQPDVEVSKFATNKLVAQHKKTGLLPLENPILCENGFGLFATQQNRDFLCQMTGPSCSMVDLIRAHLNRLQSGDYFAILAYLNMNDTHQKHLQTIRHVVRNQLQVATCLSFGPRFLHSIGQLYKGGPNNGVFLQITCQTKIDLKIPSQNCTFGFIEASQAQGDFEVLSARNRRILRVHIFSDLAEGLARLSKLISVALE